MTRFNARASFTTRTGLPANYTFPVDARDVEQAAGLAQRHVEPHALGTINLALSRVEPTETPQQRADRLLAEDRHQRSHSGPCPTCGREDCLTWASDMALLVPCRGAGA